MDIIRASFAYDNLCAVAADPAVSQQSRDRATERANFLASKWNLIADVPSV